MNLKDGATLVASIQNEFACKNIWQNGNIRFLTTDNIAIQSAIFLNEPTQLPLPFSQHFMAGILFLECFDSALILGLGGGGLPRFLQHHGIKGVAVDIDPQMPEIAQEWFAAPNNDEWDYQICDARDYLRTNQNKFDYVMFDICLGDQSPEWLEHIETLRGLKRACNDNGVVVLNYLLTDSTKFFVLYQNVRKVFDGQVAFMSIEGYMNIVILAFPKKYELCKLGLQESKISSLIARWRLDFEHMLTKMKKDTPKGSGIFG